jgi:polyadenylation factor subunit 2
MVSASQPSSALVVSHAGRGASTGVVLDKTIQASISKRTVDPTGDYITWFQQRLASPFASDLPVLRPCFGDSLLLLPPVAYAQSPAAGVATKIAHATWGKARSSVNAAAWTPDGRRCILGAGNGEFSIWNASNLLFESAMQAHNAPVRCIAYTHNQQFVISTDDEGKAKIFKPSFELMHVIQVR